ncbi:RING-H2 finger protein ATL32-like [Elaeis guineensis]|uniref:RING-type E3 ubiquitin transferase n=1 Tax=Elaeis guineensis var. tenera TaxID=51953 RepID=A0A6I9RVY6_ELAGV|nr:E3 ubiquitin-protein ligase ATL15-like [Elaeis guineensis]
MEPPPLDQPPAESFDGGTSSHSVPMLLPVFILFFFLLCFLSVFLFRDLIHYATAWLSRSGAGGGGGDGGGGLAVGGENQGEPGLDPAIIASFPTLPYSAVRGVQEGKCGAECAVCLAEFAGGDAIRLLTVCCHAFHPACIDSWLASHTTCPICRSDLEAPPDEAAVLAVREAVGEVDGHAIDLVVENGEGHSGRMRKSRSRSLSSAMDRAERGEG